MTWHMESTRATQGPQAARPLPDNVPVTSKSVSRYGAQGSKTDFPYSSTGENPATQERRELQRAISASALQYRERAVVQAQTTGFDPQTGKWLGSSHLRTPASTTAAMSERALRHDGWRKRADAQRERRTVLASRHNGLDPRVISARAQRMRVHWLADYAISR